jgi:hypothetical protein
LLPALVGVASPQAATCAALQPALRRPVWRRPCVGRVGGGRAALSGGTGAGAFVSRFGVCFLLVLFSRLLSLSRHFVR